MSIYFDLKTIEELIGDNYSRQQKQFTRSALVDTYDFSPNDWIEYITPLVDDALEEANSGVNLEHLFQKYIMVGILVGQGMTFQEAIGEIEGWEKSGISELLDKSNIIQGY